MLKQTELRILSSFFPEGKERTLKQIMEKSGLSYEPIYRNIQELARKKIISSKRFGKTLVYSLNFEKEEVKTAFFFKIQRVDKSFSKSLRRNYLFPCKFLNIPINRLVRQPTLFHNLL